jgi:hypothetical protein
LEENFKKTDNAEPIKISKINLGKDKIKTGTLFSLLPQPLPSQHVALSTSQPNIDSSMVQRVVNTHFSNLKFFFFYNFPMLIEMKKKNIYRLFFRMLC